MFETCQKLGVQLVILSRTAAYSAPVPAFIYDELASIEHPIALRLRATQVGAIEALWARAALPSGHADRRGLPDRCDRKWCVSPRGAVVGMPQPPPIFFFV